MKIDIHSNIENTIEFQSIAELTHTLQQNADTIITEQNIFQLYPEIFEHIQQHTLVLDISEHQKTLQTAQTIWEFFVNKNIARSQNVYVIGGGVLNDIALFACSVFKRGIPCISVPTTLLSMVDASIGGKNAINFLHIKNIIGNIYLPKKNIIVMDFLNTLPYEQILSGWAEILKIALVKDKNFYEECISHLSQNITPHLRIIQKAIQLKINIISKDITDTHERHLLNYGHTIAHAIEGLFDDKKKYIPHGYAVAIGIIIENDLAEKMNVLPTDICKKVNSDIQKIFSFDYLKYIELQDIPTLINKILYDKKHSSHSIHFTFIEDIGKGRIKNTVQQSDIKEVLTKQLISLQKNNKIS